MTKQKAYPTLSSALPPTGTTLSFGLITIPGMGCVSTTYTVTYTVQRSVLVNSTENAEQVYTLKLSAQDKGSLSNIRNRTLFVTGYFLECPNRLKN